MRHFSLQGKKNRLLLRTNQASLAFDDFKVLYLKTTYFSSARKCIQFYGPSMGI